MKLVALASTFVTVVTLVVQVTTGVLPPESTHVLVGLTAATSVWTLLLYKPSLARSAHTRPVYVDDLLLVSHGRSRRLRCHSSHGGGGEQYESLEADQADIFYKAFTAMITLVTGAAAGMLADDGYRRWARREHQGRSLAEGVAFVGGVLSVLRTVHSKTGSLLLYVLHRRRARRMQSMEL